jgi:four helix bundle protein
LRGKSRADFANKVTIVLEEADETDFWIELGERAGVVEPKKVEGLRQ